MLNGIDPIILFHFNKVSQETTETLLKIPIVSEIVDRIDLPPIPIYLSESLTGIYIDSEDKSVEIETSTETVADGTSPIQNQRGISSSVKVNMVASRDSVGLTLFSAMTDLIFPKVTSKEYSISYLNGAVTVFNGLLHSCSINQNADNDLYNISIEIIKPSGVAKPQIPVVEKVTGTTPL